MDDEICDMPTMSEGTNAIFEEAWELIGLSGFHHGQMAKVFGLFGLSTTARKRK